MARLQGKSPRASKRMQLVEVQDQTGGVNLRVAPTLIPQDQTRTCRNWTLGEQGALKVALGYQQFSTASFGSGRAQGAARIYLSSHTFFLLAHNSTLYKVSDLGVPSTVSPSSLSTRQVHFLYDRDIVAYFDGSTTVQKSTDGSTWTRFGIVAPSTDLTPSTLSSGAASSGEYEFAFSFKNRSLSYESNISSGSTVYLTGTTGAFHLLAGSSLSNDPQVDAYVWYGRDVTAGETVFRKISSGTASTFRVTDTNWTANDEAPTNHDVLTKGLFGTVWKNRWWVVDPDVKNRLKFSEIFLPQAFPALFFIDIPFERGDAITGVSPLGDVLVVWGQSKPFLIFGQTSLDFEVRPSAGSVTGCLGPRALAAVEQGIIHCGAEGINIFDGATDRILSRDVDTGWRDYIANTVSTELEKTPAVYELRHKQVRVAVSRAYPTNAPGEWVLNLERTRENQEAWSQTDRRIGGYVHMNGAETAQHRQGELVTWSDTTGLLFKESTGTTANSSNMVAVAEGPTLALGMHRARVLGLHVEYEPHAGALTEETLVDNVSQGQNPLLIGTGIATWGTGVWGTFLWGGAGRRKAYIEKPLAAEGRTITQRFIYNGKEQFRLFTYAFEILPESRPRQLTE